MGFRVLVVDDHEIVRRGVCSLLQGRTDWEICGEAADGREAVQKARQLKPDAVILDIGLPGLNGLDVARQILIENGAIKILILTLHDSDQVMRDVLRAGAQGFLLKRTRLNLPIRRRDERSSVEQMLASRTAALRLKTVREW